MSNTLSSYIEISRHFLRSVRIDTDLGRDDAVDAYVCQKAATALLENMARQIVETRQRAFTWTGPYGGGKSSLALALCSALSSNRALREKARKALNIDLNEVSSKAFATSKEGWIVLPIVGKRDRVQDAIAAALSRLANVRISKKPKSGELIDALVRLADETNGGVLLVVDELGKFLEAAAAAEDDIFFYQELAERASRCSGKLVIVGILHQAFEEYAKRLGRTAREEWAKVQGRFVDIPLISATDEVIELVGRAISSRVEVAHESTMRIVDPVAESIQKRRPGSPQGLGHGLYKCWPLHPITAALLGPISRRKFGQNERSTFGFLASREPLGFAEFLAGAPADPWSMYGPAQYWDYLRTNLEPAILASTDGHRWALAVEAVERSEARGSNIHVELAKSIALIDMFRAGSGLAAEAAVLEVSIANADAQEIHSALEDLARWSVIVYRKHLNAWCVYAGSDFDIESAVAAARLEMQVPDLSKLSELADVYPMLAKRHYQETGTMRWMTKRIIQEPDVTNYVERHRERGGSYGEFLLSVPVNGESATVALRNAKKHSLSASHSRILIGSPVNAGRLYDLASELSALELVFTNRPELEGDAVARREIGARINTVRSELHGELTDAFARARWFDRGTEVPIDSRHGLSFLASKIADEVYPLTPPFFSELINRDSPSSNSVKARRDLMHRMLTQGSLENLGYSGFPADAGLYYTVLKATGLHQRDGDNWRFSQPPDESSGLYALWSHTSQLLASATNSVTLADLYRKWSEQPFGLRGGVMPILALAYFLANRANLALYADGAFLPDTDEAQVDEWLQDPHRIAFKYVDIGADKRELLEALAKSLAQRIGSSVVASPLDSARALVAQTFALPSWTKRTSTVSKMAQEARRLLLRASDPHKVLFADLPTVLNSTDASTLVARIDDVLLELLNSYPNTLRLFERKLLSALDHKGSLDELRRRGESVKGVVGDFRLDAFATRLATYSGSTEDLEGLISLAVSKPPREWADRDIDAAVLQVGSWALQFRSAETMASLQDRPSSRRAISVVFGTANARSVSDAFDVALQDAPEISGLAAKLLATLSSVSAKREILLAALAEAGAHLLEQTKADSQ